MMRTATIAVVALAGLTTGALARPDARSMPCDQVQSLIRSQGAVVMSTGRNTYDRYVANSGQCFSSADVAVRSFVATQDAKSCPVWRCETIDPIDRRGYITN